MKRRSFIYNVAALTGGIIIAGKLPANITLSKAKTLKGKVIANGKGLEGVVVSDGYAVVQTDKNGKYSLYFLFSERSYQLFRNLDGVSRTSSNQPLCFFLSYLIIEYFHPAELINN